MWTQGLTLQFSRPPLRPRPQQKFGLMQKCILRRDFVLDAKMRNLDAMCRGMPEQSCRALERCSAKFLVCDHGRGFIAQCRNGFLFDPEKKECCLANEACKQPTFPPMPDPPLPTPHYCPSPTCEHHTCVPTTGCLADSPCTPEHCAGRCDGTLLALGRCNTNYCVCQNQRPMMQQCGEGMVFGPEWARCISREDAQCKVEPHNYCQFRCPGTLIAQGRCNRGYYVCQNGKTVPQHCEEGNVFEAEWGRCISRADAQCDTEIPTPHYPTPHYPTPHYPTPHYPTPYDPTPPPNDCTGKPDGTLLTLGLCNRHFRVCHDQKVIFQKCPEGQVFRKAATGGQCLSASLAGCGRK